MGVGGGNGAIERVFWRVAANQPNENLNNSISFFSSLASTWPFSHLFPLFGIEYPDTVRVHSIIRDESSLISAFEPFLVDAKQKYFILLFQQCVSAFSHSFEKILFFFVRRAVNIKYENGQKKWITMDPIWVSVCMCGRPSVAAIHHHSAFSYHKRRCAKYKTCKRTHAPFSLMSRIH